MEKEKGGALVCSALLFFYLQAFIMQKRLFKIGFSLHLILLIEICAKAHGNMA